LATTDIQYAIEIQTDANDTSDQFGIQNGYLRYVTGREVFNTGNLLLGDNCNVSALISDAEMNSMTLAMISGGSLYGSSNGIFKTVDTKPENGFRFAVTKAYGASYNTTKLWIAKGSDIIIGDVFEVVDNNNGFEVFKYVGANIWANNFIAMDGIDPASRRIDLETRATYGRNSGFNFKIENSLKVWDYFKNNEIYTNKKKVKYFALVEGEAYQVWAGEVKENKRDDKYYYFECIDSFKDLHKNLPPNEITETEFANLTDNAYGRAIPVVFGAVPFSPIYNVSKIVEGLESLPVADYDFDTKTITITKEDFFEVGDSLKLIGGGIDEAFVYEVVSVSGFNVTLDQYIGNISQTDFDNSYKPIAAGTIGSTQPAFFKNSGWFVRKLNFESTFLLSNERIGSVAERTSDSKNYLFNYSEDETTYNDISEIVELVDINGDVDIEYPFMNLIEKDTNLDQEIVIYRPNYSITGPQGLIGVPDFYAANGITSGGVQWFSRETSVAVERVGAWNREIVDKKRTDWDSVRTFGDTSTRVPFNSFVYECVVGAETFKGLSDFNLVFDFAVDTRNYIIGGSPGSLRLESKIAIETEAGEVLGEDSAVYRDWGYDIVGGFQGYAFLPDQYYLPGFEGSPFLIWGRPIPFIDEFENSIVKTEFPAKLQKIIDNTEATEDIVVKLKIIIIFEDAVPGPLKTQNIDLRVIQIGIMEKANVVKLSDGVYTRINVGEKYNGLSTETPKNVLSKILEDYDGIDYSQIEYTNIEAQRDFWYVGKTITKKKNSSDHIVDFLRQMWIGLAPSRKGKRLLSAFIEKKNIASTYTHNESNITKGSVKNFSNIPAHKVYNTFTVKYAWNPAKKKFDKSFFIDNVDQDAFPAITENWYTYVGGLSDTSYATAKAIWEKCHAAYLISGVIQKMPESMEYVDWAQDNTYDGIDNNSAGVDSVAWKYLELCVDWLAVPKGYVEYSLPISSTNVLIELFDRVDFSDRIKTNDLTRGGWVVKNEIDAKDDIINIKLILDPETPIPTPDRIVEHGNILEDTITELGIGGSTDTITEIGV
jgi:hypothetical protein